LASTTPQYTCPAVSQAAITRPPAAARDMLVIGHALIDLGCTRDPPKLRPLSCEVSR
jgi:hypothetical protein